MRARGAGAPTRGETAVQRVPATGADSPGQARGGGRGGVAVPAGGDGVDGPPGRARGRTGPMRVRAIHFVPDVGEALRFYRALGLDADVRARSGLWVELAAAGGELCLHDAASANDGAGRQGVAVNLIADEPLEAVEQRLRREGFPPEGTIVDQRWGRCLYVRAPDGTTVQID